MVLSFSCFQNCDQHLTWIKKTKQSESYKQIHLMYLFKGSFQIKVILQDSGPELINSPSIYLKEAGRTWHIGKGPGSRLKRWIYILDLTFSKYRNFVKSMNFSEPKFVSNMGITIALPNSWTVLITNVELFGEK